MKKLNLIILTAMLISIPCESQAFWFFKKKKKSSTEVVATPKQDKPSSPTKGPKNYSDVITKKAKTTIGFFSVHKVENSYFLEIPDSTLGRDLLVVNRISKSAAGSRRGFMGYAGD